MPKTTHRLNAISASNIKKPGLHPDGAGLYLRVKSSGARSWVFRYMHDRKSRYLGLGSATSVSLATARSSAGDARRLLDLGQDPIEAKRVAEREAAGDKARSMTFKECAEAYMAAPPGRDVLGSHGLGHTEDGQTCTSLLLRNIGYRYRRGAAND